MYTPEKLATELSVPELSVRNALDVLQIPILWPSWDKNQYEEIKKAVAEFVSLQNVKVGIGADPEFEVWDGEGDFSGAYNHFPLNGRIGCDGADETGEIRPDPGSPEKVAFNVRNCLIEIKRRLPAGYKISAGSGKQVPLGGHIHISGREVSRTLLSKMDLFISRPLNAKSNSDVRGSYGRFGQYRDQPHGWEYRSPCSWIAHPDLTSGALAIAWCLAGKTDKQLEGIRTKEQLMSSMGSRRPLAERFYGLLGNTKKIEEIDVWAAWKIEDGESARPAIRPVNSRDRQERLSVIVGTGDANMRTVSTFGLTSIASLQIRGASSSRSADFPIYTVFIPENWRYRGNGVSGVAIRTWELRRKIGLSVRLRVALDSSSDPDLVHEIRILLEELITQNEEQEIE